MRIASRTIIINGNSMDPDTILQSIYRSIARSIDQSINLSIDQNLFSSLFFLFLFFLSFFVLVSSRACMYITTVELYFRFNIKTMLKQIIMIFCFDDALIKKEIRENWRLESTSYIDTYASIRVCVCVCLAMRPSSRFCILVLHNLFLFLLYFYFQFFISFLYNLIDIITVRQIIWFIIRM